MTSKFVKKIETKWRRFRDWWNPNRAIVVFTAVIALTGFFQWLEMSNAGKQTDQTISILQLQQRPWIAADNSCLMPSREYGTAAKTGCELSDPKIFSRVQPAEKVTWFVQVRNTGNTPAKNAKLEASWCVSDKKEETPPDVANCGAKEVVPERPVFPNSDPFIAVGPKEFTLNQEDISDIKNGTCTFYLVGHVDYLEWGNKNSHHETDFCLMYAPHGIYALRYCKGGQRAE